MTKSARPGTVHCRGNLVEVFAVRALLPGSSIEKHLEIIFIFGDFFIAFHPCYGVFPFGFFTCHNLLLPLKRRQQSACKQGLLLWLAEAGTVTSHEPAHEAEGLRSLSTALKCRKNKPINCGLLGSMGVRIRALQRSTSSARNQNCG